MKPYYEHAGITIFHADWRDCELEQRGPFDLLLTDPPYGISANNKMTLGSSKLAARKDYGKTDWDEHPITADDITILRSLSRSQIIFGGNYFELPPSRCWLVWDKINSGDFADCELAWTNLDKAVRQFRYMWNGMLKEKPEHRVHPTQKPIALMKWCIAQAPTGVRSLVDPYMGSGTSLVAAKAAGMTAVGCEREEQYCESAALRLAQEILF